MMDFAKKELLKYGWSEGQGLGRNQDGISKPVRPKYKFDNTGLGHDVSEEFANPWWQRVYDEAAKNIVTNVRNDKVTLKQQGDPIEITTKRHKRKKKEKKSEKYDGFIKAAELIGDTEKKMDILVEETEMEKEACVIPDVDNDELFKICGYRTVHKGARHGLKMNAKLARLEQQEKDILINLRNFDSKLNECTVYNVRKRKKV